MKPFNNYSTRFRIGFTSIISALLFFLLSSIVYSVIVNLFTIPNAQKNINVIQKSSEVELNWELSETTDLSQQFIIIDDNQVPLDKNIRTYLISGLQNDREYKVKFFTQDSTLQKSKIIEFSIKPSFTLSSFKVNEQGNDNNFFLYVLPIIIILTLINIILTVWSYSYKVTKDSFIPVHLFFSVTIVPFYLFFQSIIFSINSDVNNFFFSFAASIVIGVISYILLLTGNIMNASNYTELPLAQAAKASQFIIILISCYILLIYIFSFTNDILFKICAIGLFVLYESYSSNWTLKVIKSNQILLRSVATVIIMILTVFIMSIWPVANIIYAILTCAVVYYIILSISLEIRERLGISSHLEYLFLIVLITFLLLVNSAWGINGIMIKI